MKPCTACGKPNRDQARFCGYCGHRFQSLSEATRVAQQPNNQDTSLSSPQHQSHDQGYRPTSHQQRRLCPRCTFPLQVTKYRREELDHCPRCGGTFLDPGEEREVLGAAVSPAVWKEASVTRGLGPSQFTCPADQSTLIAYTVQFGEQTVEVDLCPQCEGLWLDAKECQILRQLLLAAGQSPETALAPPRGVASYLFQLLTHFPLEVWNPRHRIPHVTVTLIGLLILVFAVEIGLAGAGESSALQQLITLFGLIPANVLSGKALWTLVTYVFFHGSLWHLIGNSYFLYVFGDNVEETLGPRPFLLLFFTAATAGALGEVAFHAQSAMPVIGASGATAGLMGAYLMLFPRVKVYVVVFFIRFRLSILWYLGFWVTFNAVMAYVGAQGVAWLAHLGGFFAGSLFALYYKDRPLSKVLWPV